MEMVSPFNVTQTLCSLRYICPQRKVRARVSTSDMLQIKFMCIRLVITLLDTYCACGIKRCSGVPLPLYLCYITFVIVNECFLGLIPNDPVWCDKEKALIRTGIIQMKLVNE